jgi:hypothetical protein
MLKREERRERRRGYPYGRFASQGGSRVTASGEEE